MRYRFVGSYGSVHEVVELAVLAEQHGWDGFFTWDAVDLGPADVWDPWAVLAAAAVRTQRIRLGALVFALPRRRPWVVARQAVTVDHLSAGRLVIPAGVGVAEDRGVAGVRGEAVDLRERAQLLDDDLAILDLAFRGETFSYAGSHHHVTDLRILPRPVQRPRVPLWVVGAWPSERSMTRAVRWDGVVVQLRGERAMETPTPTDVALLAGWVREHRAADAGPFDIVIQGILPDDEHEAAELGRAMDEAGATWWIESRWDPKTATPDALADRLRLGPPPA